MKNKTLLKIILAVILIFAPDARTYAFILGIYGNANEDDTIDAEDIAYVEGIISGRNPETRFADADYNGEVDALDLRQIELIMEGGEKALTIVDSAGMTVTIKKPVKEIVSISLYCSEPIRMYGDMDKIVAIQGNAKKAPVYFPQISRLPSIGGYPPDFEAILRFRPDMLIGATSWTKHLYGRIPDNIVPVVGLDFTYPSVFAEEIVKLGYILNRRDEAKDYLRSFYYKYLDMIESRTRDIPEQDRPDIYMEYSMGDYKAHGGMQRYAGMIGAKNIFEDLPLYSEVDPEEVIKRNPDIIIKQMRNGAGYPVNDTSAAEKERQEVMNRPELANVKAVKNGDVYILAERISYGCAYPVSLAYMAKLLHPDLFMDLDPRAMHQEFLDRFCPGIVFNAYEQGVFIYPPLKQEK